MRSAVLGLGLLMASVVYADVVSQNGIAKDSATGLTWQDDSARVDWYEAKQYCKDLRLGGFKDWRVPNRFELTTLIDSTKKDKPLIIDGFRAKLPKGEDGYLWSSDSCEHHSQKGWLLFINDDYVGDTFKSYENTKHSVRCVRGQEITFSFLQKLKNSGKLKVPQNSIDQLSPTNQEKLNKSYQKESSQQTSSSSRQYSAWDIQYKYQTGGSIPSETSFIKCSNGRDGNINYYYNGGNYIVGGGSVFKSLEAAANYICGNK